MTFVVFLTYVLIGEGVAEIVEPKAGFWRGLSITLGWPRALGRLIGEAIIRRSAR